MLGGGVMLGWGDMSGWVITISFLSASGLLAPCWTYCVPVLVCAGMARRPSDASSMCLVCALSGTGHPQEQRRSGPCPPPEGESWEARAVSTTGAHSPTARPSGPWYAASCRWMRGVPYLCESASSRSEQVREPDDAATPHLINADGAGGGSS